MELCLLVSLRFRVLKKLYFTHKCEVNAKWCRTIVFVRSIIQNIKQFKSEIAIQSSKKKKYKRS